TMSHHMGTGTEGPMTRIKRLTAREATTAKPEKGRRAAMLPDGGNLYLQATFGKNDTETGEPTIRPSWVFRSEFRARRQDLGIGSLDTFDLAEARERAKGLRQQLADGIDPFTAKRQKEKEDLAKRAAEARAMTFKQCAAECIKSHADGWKNAKHAAQWSS